MAPQPFTETPIKQSVSFLRGLLYSLNRLQELKSYWLITSQCLEEKAAIGQTMGYEKELPVQVNRRIGELFEPDNRAIMPLQLDETIKTAFGNLDTATLTVRFQQHLVAQLDKQITVVDKDADEPTYILLKQFRRVLDNSLDKLGRKPHTFADIALDKLSTVFYPDGGIIVPQIPETPARPDNFTYHPTKDFEFERCATSKVELSKFIHFVCTHIEVCAMEVCSFNIIQYPEMPLQFKSDMAQQIWDEARHYLTLAQFLRDDMNTPPGTYPYQLTVWQLHQRGENLMEQLAIEQILQEGDAVVTNANLIHGLNQLQIYPQLANLLTFVNADESMHTKNGNRWLRYLCGKENASYMDILHKSAEKMNKGIFDRVIHRPGTIKFLNYPEEYGQFVEQEINRRRQQKADEPQNRQQAQPA